MATILVHLPQSPWSEKARWSLDHHGITYRAVEHVPLVFEPLLRLLSRNLRKHPTVPMLFDRGGVLTDSVAIALHTDTIGKGTPLFPRQHENDIFHWNEEAERLSTSARARLMTRMLDSPAALLEAVPPPLSALGGAVTPLARLGASFVASKYHTRSEPVASGEAAISQVLEHAEARLTGKQYLVGDTFTYADVAIACSLGFIAPHARQRLGPASRDIWREPQMAAAFPRLIAWRDQLFELHR